MRFARPLRPEILVVPARLARAELPLRASLTVFAMFVCCVIFGVFAINAIHARDLAVAENRKEVVNLAASLAQQAGDTFEALDGALLALAGRIESAGIGPTERGRLRESMAALVLTMPRLHGLLVLDEHGNILVSNESAAERPDTNFSREPYFVYHRRHASNAVRISAPERSEMDDSTVIEMTRRLQTADGRFAGVIVAQIAVEYFEQIYASVDVGRQGAIALILDDGTLAVRYPRVSPGPHKYLHTPFFSDPDFRYAVAGTFVRPSPVDGVRRLTAFRRLDRYPLIISVSLAESEYLANWRSDSWANVAALVVLAAVIAGLARGLTAQIGRREEAEDSLAKLALIDGLTGLANRRQFDAVLAREWRSASRDRTPLTLLMIDVDNFKAFNDRYGHQSGDAVLTSIAQAVDAATLRPRDVAARYGGEEFAVVLPGIDAVSALHVAERIRLAVIELAIPHAGGAAHVASVSIGIATAAPMSFDDRTAIIEGADAALYEAKRLGRNRSCSSSAIAGRTQSAKSIVIPESA